MKILLFLFGLFLPTATLLADGPPTYRLSITVELVNGSARKGYYIQQDLRYEADSLTIEQYFEKVLSWEYRGSDGDDSVIFYKDILEYSYVWPGAGGDTVNTFQLVNEVKIPYRSIKHIRVNSCVESGYGSIMNELKLSDTKWLKKPPAKHVNLNGYLCGFLVIVHQSDKEVEAILKELEALEKKYLEDIDPEKEGNNGDKPMGYDIDNEFFEILYKLKGHKVVVIESCTC